MIISLGGQKGGTGKTTLAVCLAAWWHSCGLRGLLCDADPQRSVLTWGEQAQEAGHSAPTIMALGADLWRQEQLPSLAQNYDRVVIDTPPRLGAIQRAALLASDVAVIPWRPGPSDAWALAETLEVIETARGLRSDLLAVALLAQVDARTAMGRGARAALSDCGLHVLEASIGLRVSYAEALAMGQGVTEYAPASVAAEEIKALVGELEALVGKDR